MNCNCSGCGQAFLSGETVYECPRCEGHFHSGHVYQRTEVERKPVRLFGIRLWGEHKVIRGSRLIDTRPCCGAVYGKRGFLCRACCNELSLSYFEARA